MINAPKESNHRPAAAWTAGVGILFLAIGLSGAVTPLAPALPPPTPAKSAQPAEEPMVEIFSEEGGAAAPPEAGPETPAAEPDLPPETEPEPADLPPPPDIPPPLTPPEMPELIPLQSPPPPRPVSKPSTPPKPRTAPAPATPARSRTGTPQSTGQTGGTPGGQGTGPGTAPGSGRGTGKGRTKGYFPQPPYPAAARRAGLEGTVTFSVIVDAAGNPLSAVVKTSSGHAILDNAALPFLLKNWRWAEGDKPRRSSAPIKFYLE